MDKLELLKSRRSVRSFTTEPLPKVVINKLRAEITMTNTHEQGFRFQLITDDPNPLRGVSKFYGSFRNPRNYLAAVVDTATPNALERAGYFAERFVVQAISEGLGTCFVGSTFNRKEVNAQIRAGEEILFLVLVGYPAEKEKAGARLMSRLVHLRKKTYKDFFQPVGELEKAFRICPELKDGLEGIACAPSALNRQPVRVILKEIEGREVACAKVDNEGGYNLIDLGIAKFNYNFATSTECEWGNGSPLVAV
ncbi:MAG: nitroreductase family protein [Muribaculaceae bacterium]|nr:nitroreductase family protein [Muribaculaceae bacterium]